MKRTKQIIAVALCAFAFVAAAQQNDFGVGIGKWRTHLPYQKVIDVDIMHSRVYAATPYELFYYDTEDYSLNILNKINGLSDVGVKAIRYSSHNDLLLVAYTNANIDLVHADGKISNISDIKNASIMGNKTINDICFDNNMAYLSCGFGIVVIDLSRKEVKDTYFIGDHGKHLWINDIALLDGNIYAASVDGLYHTSLTTGNPADYSQWQIETSLPQAELSEVEAWNGQLIVNKVHTDDLCRDTLFLFDGTSWAVFQNTDMADDNFSCIRVSNNMLYLCGMYGIYFMDNNMNVVETEGWPGGSTNPLSVVAGNGETIWIGDTYRGLIMSEHRTWGNEMRPYGPETNNVFELKSAGNDVWVATGGRQSDWSKMWNNDGVAHYNGESWETVSSSQIPDYPDFVSSAVNPLNNSNVFLASWGHGVFELENGNVVNHFDETNSSLRAIVSIDATLVGGVAFDSKNALWAVNSGANDLLSRYKDGAWQSYNLGPVNSAIDVGSMMIDNNDSKWIIKRMDGMILVFNENYNVSEAVTLTSEVGHGNLPGATAYCMATDLNGAVWIGTDKGIAVIYNPQNIFISGKSYDASLIMVPRNDGSGQADALFSGQKILSIAVDGGNNKWIATEGGVYQMSPDGLTRLNYFSTENSPLLTNAVNTMAINDDGEVFFGTDNGIISYRGNASKGKSTSSDVVVYPNPVRPDYDGPIGIKGLVSDSEVKITTVGGSLVKRLESDGGQAVWDRTTIDGRQVTSGVYLVFASDKYGIETCVARIVLIQK